ncbi:MAG: hypothetical protein HY660_09000, partial [Armatimonadetes bacterium]|nr:hypothetical protein [Armatimonadota bacterium]
MMVRVRRHAQSVAALAVVASMAWGLLVVAGSQAAPAAPQRGGTVTIAVGTDALTLDPHNYLATTDIVVDNMIFDTLVSFDLNMKIRPRLALRWLYLGPTSWRFELRKDVKFSDGTPFNAQAAKVSLERAARSPRAAAFVGFIKQVDIVNEHTIVIQTNRPFAPVLNHLTSAVGGLMAPSSLGKPADDIKRQPVGTGPYMLREWIPNQRLVIVPNPTYWGDKP